MVATSTTDQTTWHNLTLGFLGGLTIASILFTHIAVIQTPGLDPPPETAALFIVASAAAGTSYILVKQRSALGYIASIITGILIILEVAIIILGIYGPAGSQTNPIGPVVYLGFTIVVIITAAFAWRDRYNY